MLLAGLIIGGLGRYIFGNCWLEGLLRSDFCLSKTLGAASNEEMMGVQHDYHDLQQ